MIGHISTGVSVSLTLTPEDAGIITSALWKAYNITQDEAEGCMCDHCTKMHGIAMQMYTLMGEVYDAQYDLARDI